MASIRLAKIALTAGAGLLFLIVGLDNCLDYSTNFDVVKHILAMDMIPPGPLSWRAITATWFHHLAYLGIILVEIAAGVATLAGAARLWRARAASAHDFNREKALANDDWRRMVSDVARWRLQHAGTGLPLYRQRRPYPAFFEPAG